MSKDSEQLADSSPIKGVTMVEYQRNLPPYLTEKQLASLMHQRMWLVAARIMDELIYEALDARAFGFAKEQIGLLQDPDDMALALKVNMELMKPTEKTLGHLEEIAREDLRDSKRFAHVELAVALLRHYPALGIYFARGCVSSEHELDSYTLVDYIETARDMLNLPQGDRAEKILDFLLDEEVAQCLENNEKSHDGAADSHTHEEIENLMVELKEAQERSRELEEQVRSQERTIRESLKPPEQPGVNEDEAGIITIESFIPRKDLERAVKNLT
jgi:hypothetical protein